jgi:hypothetical protein
VRDESYVCLLSHKCNDRTHGFCDRLISALASYNIRLLKDPFRVGDECSTRMKTFDFDALIFLSSPESWASKPCQLELKTARHRAVPIFTALLEGDVPKALRRRIYWKPYALTDEEFGPEVHSFANAISTRVSLHKNVQLITQDNPPDVTRQAALNITEEGDRTVIAEFVRELASRYCKVADPNTRFWIALAIGKAGTCEAAKLLRKLPTKDHPYPLEGIRQALEMIAQGDNSCLS